MIKYTQERIANFSPDEMFRYAMLKEKYGNDVRSHAEKNLMFSFTVEYADDTYNRVEKERASLNLYREVLEQPELKEQIISELTDLFLVKLVPYYSAAKYMSDKEFLTSRLDIVASPMECLAWAEFIDKELKSNTKAKTK